MHYIRNAVYTLVIYAAEFGSVKSRKYNLHVFCKYNTLCSTYFIVVVSAGNLKGKIS